MRIAWITTGIAAHENDLKGAAAITNLLKELSCYKDIELIVFSLYYPAYTSLYNLFESKVHSFGRKPEPGRFDKIFVWKNCSFTFEREHKFKSFDLIHSMWSGESGYVSSRLSKKFNIPMITNINGGELGEFKEINFGSRLKFFQKYFVNKTFRQSKIIVCGSGFISDKVTEFYGSEIRAKLRLIPFGVDVKLFKSDLPLAPSLVSRGQEFRIICVANVVPVKSHIDLFKAFKIVLQNYPDTNLICCGQDKNNILTKIATELGISANVEIKGFVDYKLLPDLLRKSDIFVSSSIYESQNMSILEAAFCGLPVVSTNVGVAPEITNNIVKPGDYKALAEKMIYVLENVDIEKRHAADNLAGLREKFSLKASAEKFYEMYKSLA